ncbi:pentatricopeptide repeat-containing protein At1g31430 [Coffea eugenioides]|uniref:pentatricopeptide repeat-containing protein At1g31430 n=1 Tax=Coffea eugenioides TaxID=49369 RepID=UPI000F612275|nr:pentatricopeptide repeat-containing protein At1g31430 [Coffea eugenioides]
MKPISRQFVSHLSTAPSSRTTILTKKSSVYLLKTCKSMTHLMQIQAQVLILGLHQNLDIIHKLVAFTADPFLGNLGYAQRIFDHVETPSLFIYNVMIKAHTKAGNFRKALCLFDQLRKHGLWPDNYTYPFVFKAIGELKSVREGEKIHGFVLKSGDGFDCYVCNSIMDCYGVEGSVDSLRKVFDEMRQRDLVSWNVLISGFVRCHKFEDAIGVYTRMRQEANLKPDEATVVSTLSACTALRNLELGREIHDYVSNELELTVIIGNALLDMYSKCGCLNIARQIFDTIPNRNVICWTSMVSGYISNGKLDDARELFDRSPVRDLVLWTAMINGYVQFNRVDDALALFREMQMERIIPDKFTLVTLLTGCAQLGAMEQGEWLHACIEENRISIDAVVGTALIEMYAKCGFIEKSLAIFNTLKEKDTASWTALICALAMNGESCKALELFSGMKQAGIKPDDITFIGVLSACSHGGLVEEGRQHFDSMKNVYHIEPKLEHYGCLIDLFGRAGLLGEAQDMIANIPNKDNKIVVPLYGALLSACRTYGDVDMGERIANILIQIQCSDSSTHSLLANIYASANRWEDVKKVRREMSTLGFKKSPGCSSIEVDSNIHELIAGHLQHWNEID